MLNTGEFKNSNDKYPVLLNAYNLNLNSVVDVVFKHEIKFQAFLPSITLKSEKVLEEKWKDLWKGPKNE